MSRPRYWWHMHIKAAIGRYKLLKSDSSEQSDRLSSAIKWAERETRRQVDGDLKMKAVKMVLMDRTHTSEGAAMKLYVSERTIHTWCSNFVRLVGKRCGYMSR